ncbi:MAG: aminopeptidase [bacterium]
MQDKQAMISAALGAMTYVLYLEPEHAVLVVTDEATAPIGEAFREAAASHGCPTDTWVIPEAERPMQDPPAELLARLDHTALVINTLLPRADETPFRIKWLKAIEKTKRIRCGHCPGITAEMMTGGPMNIDYKAMRETARQLIGAFAGASTTRITTPAGTDLLLELTDRAFLSDVGATDEYGCNLPCGEIYCAPVENGANGVLVVDGTISSRGFSDHPLHISVENGAIVGLDCENPTVIKDVEGFTGVDPEAKIIGELGIGVNPGAKLIGNMLEDEKALHTGHIAFGNNEEFGGQNRSATHHDFLFRYPTFQVTYADGSSRLIIEDGEFRF